MFLKKLSQKIILLFFMGISFLAHAEASQTPWPPRNPVLLDSITNVGFASPDYVGTYHFQVLTNGVVQKIDNKNQIKTVTLLDPKTITHLMENIDAIPSDLKIDTPQRDGCMDAPSTKIYAHQNDGESILIRARQNCIDLKSNNETANNIAEWLIKLSQQESEVLIHSLMQLPQNIFAPINKLLGQEGYGHPRDPFPIMNETLFVCREKEPKPDDGFILYVDRIVGAAANEFQMTIEKSLFTGTKTETHKVIKQVQGRPEEVVKYVSDYNYVSLTIYQRAPHDPNKPFTAKFERKGDDSIMEARDLVCQYHIN